MRKFSISGVFCMLTILAVAGVCFCLPKDKEKTMNFVAHRGESCDAPENTMAAFELAWERGDKWIELDVYVTQDGAVAVHHDDNTANTGDIKLPIRESTFAELQKVDVGVKKDPKWKGQRIPSLSQVIAKMPDKSGYGALVELKAMQVEQVKNVAEVIKQSGRNHQQFVIISFSTDLLKQAKKLLPDIECRLLVGCDSKMTPDEKRAFLTKLASEMVANGFGSVGPAWPDIDKATVDMFHAAGLTVHPWTVDDPATAQKLIDMGVDSITSNCPKRLADSLAKK